MAKQGHTNDLAPDLANALGNGLGVLSQFDDKDVIAATIAITNAGDGLSEALKVEPREFHHGETVVVVLECEVAKVRFDPIKDTDALRRVHFLRAGTATIVDGDLVAEQLKLQAEKNERAREAAEGKRRIPFSDDEVTLRTAHADGEHADGLVIGCPLCQEEQDLMDAEAGA